MRSRDMSKPTSKISNKEPQKANEEEDEVVEFGEDLILDSYSV
jgi:hypothetical protein